MVAAHAGRSSALGLVKEIFLSNTPYEIVEASWMPSGWKLHVKGISSDTEVKALRGKPVHARKSDLPEAAGDQYYIADLEGMIVRRSDNQETVGTFAGIEAGENGVEWWKVRGEAREWLVPPKKHFIERVDRTARTIWVQHWDELP